MPESVKRALETAGFLFGITLVVTVVIYFEAVGLHRFGLPTPAQAAAGIAPNGINS